MFSSSRHWNSTTNHNWFLFYPFLITVNPTAIWNSIVWDISGVIQITINTFKQINQPDATISQVYYLSFMYSSTCFGCPHAHHQDLNNCSSSLWFYRWSVVVAVLLVVVGPVVTMCVMMCTRTPITCWAVLKRQVINLGNCCIWLVICLNAWWCTDLQILNPKKNHKYIWFI
jgi:hypothetical protein